MEKLKTAICAIALAATSVALAGVNEDAVHSVLTNYLPGTSALGKIKVEKVAVNPSSRTVNIKCNETVGYIPLTAETLQSLKKDIAKALGKTGYKVTISANGTDLTKLTLGAPKKNLGPTETEPFVTRPKEVVATKGLEGANIAMWQSHGWYFEPKLNRWEWQRARIMQTVEDLYTQSFVMPYLMPMLENAGAYVMSPRERDTNLHELIIDNDDSSLTAGKVAHNGRGWKTLKDTPGFAYTTPTLTENQNPFRQGTVLYSSTAKDGKGKISWDAAIPADGRYAVYVSYATVPNSTTNAHYTIHAQDGDHPVFVNQKMGGGTWVYLGHYPFEAGGETALVTLTNNGHGNEIVTADAVKIGGGMGNVARIIKERTDSVDYQYMTSGYPRYTEAARYFMQWAGVPDSVYTPSDNVNDYTDDYRSRGNWVNWLAGGSSMLPGQEGLGIPVDLSFAFHSDAGSTLNDSIIGTLGIYSTAGDTLGNGSTRLASRDLTDYVMTAIVNDVRQGFEPKWTRRGMWDQRYFEARAPQVPAMLLELLSHQNYADMKYGLDPAFRFTVSRAIYKGMLRYLAARDGRDYVVQPLPVKDMAIFNQGSGNYMLTWEPTPDATEPTAVPTSYIVQMRKGTRGAFRNIAKVDENKFIFTAPDDDIYSFRIVAANDGGLAFPGEILALSYRPDGHEDVLIVNGFTRISGPDNFDAGTIAGFYDAHDHGVPYIEDISFIGSQFEYRRDIPWMDDDAAGFGASRANYEDKVIAGNTFDYVLVHGEALAELGYGFTSMSASAYANTVPGTTPRIIDLIMGKQKEIHRGTGAYGTYYKTFPAELQQRLRRHTADGGDIFVSGAYIASDLWDNPHSSKEVAEADQKFATEVLGYHWRVDQASVTGEAFEVPTRYRDFTTGEYRFHNTLSEDFYAVESPDSFYPADTAKGATFMRYAENNLIAGTVYAPGNYRVVAIGFPFETIKGADSRRHLMKQVMDFFGPDSRTERPSTDPLRLKEPSVKPLEVK